MNISNPLALLVQAGLTVRVVDGNRLAVAPAHRLTMPLRQHIREHKPELLALLAANDSYHATATQSGAIQYRLQNGRGGFLIDPDGIASAIATLQQQYGERLDWPALVDTLQGMGEVAQEEAAKLIERLNKAGR